MNKEQIAKHKDIMLWFIENPDKGVWIKGGAYSVWHLHENPEFTLVGKYIQNDEYAELRKAQADGKVIEWTDNPNIVGRTWYDNTTSFDMNIFMYRIKPDEPEFKDGDWFVVLADALS